MTSSFWTFSFAIWFITEKHREYVYALRLLLCDGLHWFADIYGFCLWLRVLLLAVPLHRKLLSQPLLREANRTSSDWRVGLTAVAPVNWASVAKLYPAIILYQSTRIKGVKGVMSIFFDWTNLGAQNMLKLEWLTSGLLPHLTNLSSFQS